MASSRPLLNDDQKESLVTFRISDPNQMLADEQIKNEDLLLQASSEYQLKPTQ